MAATRRIEELTASALPPHTQMQRAGLAVARLSLAVPPHAHCVWVACGPGNNGGDSCEAALHLHQWGERVVVTWTGAGKHGLPADAKSARAKALAAGVLVCNEAPEHFDFCIDALLGIGANLDPARKGSARILNWLQIMHRSATPCLTVDLPSGLNADTGASNTMISGATNPGDYWTNDRFTLQLLTLKPGLFTCQGPDSAGEIWFDDLGVTGLQCDPSAWLLGADRFAEPSRRHAEHKGSFGDVAVLGGESTSTHHMTDAALLAASAALHRGAGRVFVALLGDSTVTVNPAQPELMFRSLDALDLDNQVVVCGCGGGEAIKVILPRTLNKAARLVLDADGLNAVANDTSLQRMLAARDARGHKTVLTPHPLEAARLLQTTTAQVQFDRPYAAVQLAKLFQCVVVLKGSGSVITAPGRTCRINPS